VAATLLLLPGTVLQTRQIEKNVISPKGCYVGNWLHAKSSENQQNIILRDKNSKGDETEASSYRPIGLANTLYKLRTHLITNTLCEYAEANSILSTTHTSWFLQTKRPHSPAQKRDYGTRRCQTLSQRHECPYCGFDQWSPSCNGCM
jgi:hypothetical protein